MTTFIYARVSTDLQTTDNQTSPLLERFPDATVITETASGAKTRPLLDELIARMAKGDTLVIVALDRLGRRCGELVTLLDSLTSRGIILISLREGIDLGTIAGRFVANVMAALAQVEREIIGERTKTSLAARKASGMKLGAPRQMTDGTIAKMHELRSSGMSLELIARILNTSAAQVSRYLKKSQTSQSTSATITA